MTVRTDAEVSTTGFVKAGATQAIMNVAAISNEKYDSEGGTLNATAQNTTGNYEITLAPWSIEKKALSLKNVNKSITTGTSVNSDTIKALFGLDGIVSYTNAGVTDKDFVEINFTGASYKVNDGSADVYNGNDINAAAAAISTASAKTYTITLTLADVDKIEGIDAANYILSGTTKEATLTVYTPSSGGGGGGGGAIIVPPTPATSGHAAYMQGDDLGYFRPDANMTRAEAATVFYNILTDKSMGEEPAVFTDVNSGDWYAKAVTVLASKGILGGYEDGSFQPSKSITRAEFVTIASRLKGMSSGSASFSDVPSTHWAYDYITSAASKGWITGYPDGTFRPEANITRAEVATIVNRMYGRIPDEDYIDANIDDISIMRDVKKSHWAFYQIIEATNGHDAYKDDKGNEVWTEIL